MSKFCSVALVLLASVLSIACEQKLSGSSSKPNNGSETGGATASAQDLNRGVFASAVASANRGTFSAFNGASALLVAADGKLCVSKENPTSPLSMHACFDENSEIINRWVYTDGYLQAADGSCLAADSQTKAAITEPCNANNDHYRQFLLLGGGIVALPPANSANELLNLSQDLNSVSLQDGGSKDLRFAPFGSYAREQQTWSIAGVKAGNGNTIYTVNSNDKNLVFGVTIQAENSNVLCLVPGNPVRSVPCAIGDANIYWNIGNTGLVTHQMTGQCLASDQNNEVFMSSCQKNQSTFWGIENGSFYNAWADCLELGIAGAATTRHCTIDGSMRFTIGVLAP